MDSALLVAPAMFGEPWTEPVCMSSTAQDMKPLTGTETAAATLIRGGAGCSAVVTPGPSGTASRRESPRSATPDVALARPGWITWSASEPRRLRLAQPSAEPVAMMATRRRIVTVRPPPPDGPPGRRRGAWRYASRPMYFRVPGDRANDTGNPMGISRQGDLRHAQ